MTRILHTTRPGLTPEPHFYTHHGIAMQLLDEPWITLDTFLDDDTNQTNPITRTIQQNIKNSVRTLKQHDIVHNDLHLNNIMVHPQTGEVKFIDWGRSRVDGTFTQKDDNRWLQRDNMLTTIIRRRKKIKQSVRPSLMTSLYSRTNKAR